MTGWGYEGVIVFFVLSGFLVGGLASAKASIGSFILTDYGIDRVTRIFVAFLPALILTALLDLIGSSAFSATGFYNHTHPMIHEKFDTAPFITHLTPKIFLMNAAQLQTFLAPPFGSNLPLWTISAEFWFYVVFGLALFASVSPSMASRSLSIVLLGVTIVVLGERFPVLMGLWLIGTATAFVPWRTAERPLLALLLFAGVLVFVRLRQDIFEHDKLIRTAKDYLVALAFAWLLISMRHVRFRPLQRLGRFNSFMADFSYSLYLVHFPLMLFLLGALHSTGYFDGIARGYRPTDAEGLFLYVAMIVIVYCCAWGFAQATEMHTRTIRRALKARLAPSPI